MVKVRKIQTLPDPVVSLTILLLLIFGVVMVYDASVVYAEHAFGGRYYFLILQTFWVLLSIFASLVVSRIDYHLLERVAPTVFLIGFILLSLLALHSLMPRLFLGFYETFVPRLNGAHRWLYLNYSPLPTLPIVGRIGFQPSEVAKISLTLFLAHLLVLKKKETVPVLKPAALVSLILGLALLGPDRYYGLILIVAAALTLTRNRFLQMLGVTLIFADLILVEPDFGTAAVLVGAFLIVSFAAGVPLVRLVGLLVLVSLFGLLFILASPYRFERLKTFLSPAGADSLSSRYQINQILIALGSGGWLGEGMGKSIQKYGYVPEVSTDSIFSIVGEEFGFVGTLLLVLLFLFLLIRSLWITERLADDFGKYLGVGIVSLLGLQIFVNLFSMAHLIPLTGIPLPLISYGGSSLLVNMVALGIVLNMSRQMVKDKERRG